MSFAYHASEKSSGFHEQREREISRVSPAKRAFKFESSASEARKFEGFEGRERDLRVSQVKRARKFEGLRTKRERKFEGFASKASEKFLGFTRNFEG